MARNGGIKMKKHWIACSVKRSRISLFCLIVLGCYRWGRAEQSADSSVSAETAPIKVDENEVAFKDQTGRVFRTLKAGNAHGIMVSEQRQHRFDAKLGKNVSTETKTF